MSLFYKKLFLTTILLSSFAIKTHAADSVWTEHNVSGSLDWIQVESSADGSHLAALNYMGNLYISSDYGNNWTLCEDVTPSIWRSMSMSADGRIIGITSHYNKIITSHDYGETWEEQQGSRALMWSKIKVSPDGSKMFALGSDGSAGTYYIYTSMDAGVTWVEQTAAGRRNWSGLTSSYDGTRLAAIVTNSYIYTSSDSGTTWVPQTNSQARAWVPSLAQSADGKYIVAAVNNGAIYTSEDYGVNWNPQANSGSRAWAGISMSSDGSKLVAKVNNGYIYTSEDYGVNWDEHANSDILAAAFIAISDDATKIITVARYAESIYVSTDFGSSWTAINIPHQTGNWKYNCGSDSGQKLAAASMYNGYIFTSNDYGATWTKQTNAGARNWTALACSSDGSFIAATASGGYIYTSQDSGVSWTQRDGAGAKSWYSLGMSSNGSHIYAGINNGYIYYSSNYGESWAPLTNPGSRVWVFIDVSSDGKNVIASTYGNYVYTSNNYGETWAPHSEIGARTWWSVSSSSDGSVLAAVAANDYIYTSKDSGDTWVKSSEAGMNNWVNVDSSQDGSIIYATTKDIYRGGDTSVYFSKNSGDNWAKLRTFESPSDVFVTATADASRILTTVNNGHIYTATVDLDPHPPEITLDPISNPNRDPTPTFTGSVLDNTGFADAVYFSVDSTEEEAWETCDFNNVNDSDDQSFEGSFPPLGYELSGNVNWSQTNSVFQDQSYSAQSGAITHDQTSTMTKSYVFEEDIVMSFYWKVDSEVVSDMLFLCVDSQDCTKNSGYYKRISSSIDWEEVQIELSAGTHTISWNYSKDANTSTGSDRGWVDNITFRSAKNFTCNTPSDLSNGEHTVYVKSVDSRGDGTSPGQEFRKTFTVDYDVLVSESDNSTKVSEDGLTDSISLSLVLAPTHNVVVNILSSDDQLEFTPTSLTFTPGNWADPQEVSLSMVNNNQIDEETKHAYLSFQVVSDDPNYSDSEVSRVQVKLADHDYGDRINSETEEKIAFDLKSINSLKIEDLKSKNGETSTINTDDGKLELKFNSIDSDADIKEYSVQIQKLDELGRPTGSYKTLISGIKHKSEDFNDKIKKDGFSITYKDGSIRIKITDGNLGLEDGTYNLKLKAYDYAGNSVQTDKIRLVVGSVESGDLTLENIGTIKYSPSVTLNYFYTENVVSFIGKSFSKDTPVKILVNNNEVAQTDLDENYNYNIQAFIPNGKNEVTVKSGDKTINFYLTIGTDQSQFPELKIKSLF